MKSIIQFQFRLNNNKKIAKTRPDHEQEHVGVR